MEEVCPKSLTGGWSTRITNFVRLRIVYMGKFIVSFLQEKLKYSIGEG